MATIALGGFWTSVVLAEEPVVAAKIELSSPERCPDKRGFLRAVERRGVRIRAPVHDERALLLDVVITRTADGARGRLEIVEPDGHRSERTVTTVNCAEATDALGLIAALALREASLDTASDLSAATDGSGHSAPPASSSSEAVDAPQAPASAGAAPSVSGEAVSPSFASSREPPRPPAPRSSTPNAAVFLEGAESVARPSEGPWVWTFEASAAGYAVSGIGPDVVAGAAVRAGASLARRGFWWTPSLRLSLANSVDRSFSSDAGTASFGILVSAGEVCPLVSFAVGGGELSPCVVGELGTLRASGSDTSNPQSKSRPWAAFGFEGAYARQIFGSLFWDVSVAALAPIDRDRFTMGADTVFETPKVVARAALGLGVRLSR
jgi:hypothetical protein